MEVLIVCGIISILCLMLMPLVNLLRSASKSALCAANLRQINLAILAYASDNHASLPAGNWLASSNQYASWDDQLCTYDGREALLSGTGGNTIGNCHLSIDASPPSTYHAYAMYTCPAETMTFFTGSNREWGRSYGFPSGYQGSGRARAMSVTNPSAQLGLYFPVRPPAGGGYPDGNAPNSYDWAAKLSSLGKSSTTILLAEIRFFNYGILGGPWGVVIDGTGVNSNADTHYDGLSWNSGYNSQVMYQASAALTADQKLPLHRGKWNYLFADGHIQLLLESETTLNNWQR
jgi:prepilin-type processing-associated H-X9-DG protein